MQSPAPVQSELQRLSASVSLDVPAENATPLQQKLWKRARGLVPWLELHVANRNTLLYFTMPMWSFYR